MHSKDKGSIAEAFVISDLTQQGFRIALPMGENLPFDLIAIRPDFQLLRIQVKYRSLDPNGTVSIKLASTWKNSEITRIVQYDLNVVDYFAIYCPEAQAVAYVPSSELRDYKVIALRVTPSRNNQAVGIRDFGMYETL
jgi:hypothetical protein